MAHVLCLLLLMSLTVATTALPGDRLVCPKASYCMAIDESNSLSRSEFATLTQGAVALSFHLAQHASASYLSAVSYTTSSLIIQKPTTDPDEISASLEANKQSGGNTYVGAGLDGCRNLLRFEPGPHVVILLSNGDGPSGPALQAADRLKKSGASVVVMAIQLATRDSSLDGVATEKLRFDVERLIDFPNRIDSILHDLCGRLPSEQPMCTNGDCPAAAVCYAVDESGSMKGIDWDREVHTLVGITNVFEILSPMSTYAVAGFADLAHVVSKASFDPHMVTEAILRNQRIGGQTASGTGLLKCYDLIKHIAGPKVIVIITDGRDNKPPLGIKIAPMVKANGVQVVSVGIGRKVNVAHAIQMASGAPNKYYTEVSAYAVFSQSIGSIIKDMCHASANWKPPAPPSQCGLVWCATCGGTLECYANSGSAVTDDRACRAMLQPNLCGRRRRETKCRQECGGRPPVKCYKGASFGLRVKTAKCKGVSKDGSALFPRDFALYKACENNNGRLNHRCVRNACVADRKGCWPESYKKN